MAVNSAFHTSNLHSLATERSLYQNLIKEAIQHSIYRVKPSGKIYEGDYEVAMDEDELVKYLVDEDHQDDLLVLEKKLKSKKLAAV